MTLTVFEDTKGIWIRDPEEESVIPFERSSIDISVTDGSGCVLDGAIRVNGKHFPVVRGRCKILTEALALVGWGTVEYLSPSGIKRECASIRKLSGKGWLFPLPSDSLSDEEILSLLRRLERMREKLASAKALCSDKVSAVLGI